MYIPNKRKTSVANPTKQKQTINDICYQILSIKGVSSLPIKSIFKKNLE